MPRKKPKFEVVDEILKPRNGTVAEAAKWFAKWQAEFLAINLACVEERYQARRKKAAKPKA